MPKLKLQAFLLFPPCSPRLRRFDVHIPRLPFPELSHPLQVTVQALCCFSVQRHSMHAWAGTKMVLIAFRPCTRSWVDQAETAWSNSGLNIYGRGLHVAYLPFHRTILPDTLSESAPNLRLLWKTSGCLLERDSWLSAPQRAAVGIPGSTEVPAAPSRWRVLGAEVKPPAKYMYGSRAQALQPHVCASLEELS